VCVPPANFNIDAIMEQSIDKLQNHDSTDRWMSAAQYDEWVQLQRKVHAKQLLQCQTCQEFDVQIRCIRVRPTKGKNAPATEEEMEHNVLHTLTIYTVTNV